MKSFSIGTRTIGPDNEPFIIAEMSGNHNQSLERALQIVEVAAKAGAHARAAISKGTPITWDVV